MQYSVEIRVDTDRYSQLLEVVAGKPTPPPLACDSYEEFQQYP